jgi:MGT family glycosyltransferase
MSAPAHIAMVGSTAPSHVTPSLPLFRALVRRGHRITYAIGSSLAPMVADTGATPLEHPSLLPTAEGDWGDDVVAGMSLFLDEAIAVLPRLLPALADDPPDLVLHDIGGLAGPVIAHRLGVPAVQLSPTFVAWEGYEDDMAEQIAALRASEGGRRYYDRFGAWLVEHGVDRHPDDLLARPSRGLALIPRVLQPNAERVGPAFRFVGPCIDEEAVGSGWRPGPGDGRPLLYVAFGTAYNDQLPVYRAVADRFGGGDWRVVMAVGERIDPAMLGPLPDGVEVHRWVDQMAVLEQASVFVTHAGMGSTMQSLWHGVPTVAVPQAVDQFANAQQLADIGAGRHLSAEDATPDALEDAVRSVAADPRIAARLAELRAEVRASGGAGHAADAVEALL